MTTYTLMTRGGMHCGHLDAYSAEEATAAAEREGYEVLEVTEHEHEQVLVVA